MTILQRSLIAVWKQFGLLDLPLLWVFGSFPLAHNASCNSVSIGLFWPAVKKRPIRTYYILEGQCAGPKVCPLSRVQAGTTVCIKHLSTAPELTTRLREMGLCEKQIIRLIARDSNFICQVCNARLGISEKLAESILVEALPAEPISR